MGQLLRMTPAALKVAQTCDEILDPFMLKMAGNVFGPSLQPDTLAVIHSGALCHHSDRPLHLQF